MQVGGGGRSRVSEVGFMAQVLNLYPFSGSFQQKGVHKPYFWIVPKLNFFAPFLMFLQHKHAKFWPWSVNELVCFVYLLLLYIFFFFVFVFLGLGFFLFFFNGHICRISLEIWYFWVAHSVLFSITQGQCNCTVLIIIFWYINDNHMISPWLTHSLPYLTLDLYHTRKVSWPLQLTSWQAICMCIPLPPLLFQIGNYSMSHSHCEFA